MTYSKTGPVTVLCPKLGGQRDGFDVPNEIGGSKPPPYKHLTGDAVGRGFTPAENLFIKLEGINISFLQPLCLFLAAEVKLLCCKSQLGDHIGFGGAAIEGIIFR